MCCHVNECCCGCTNMKTGITVAGLIDIFLLLALGTVNYILVPFNYGAFWGVLLVIADIFLLCGATGDNPCLLVIWMVINMIYIVLLFIGWIVIPLFIIFGRFCSHVESDDSLNTFYIDAYNTFHNQNHDTEFGLDLDYYNKASSTWSTKDSIDWMCKDATQISLIITGVIVIILPIYYLYLWIVVKSHRENLVRHQSGIQPIVRNHPSIQQHQQPMIVMPNGSLQSQQPPVMEPMGANLYYQPPSVTQQPQFYKPDVYWF